MVAGIGTEVGKTVVSAILTTMLSGEYWKPIECGNGNFDSMVIKELIDSSKHRIHQPSYSFDAPLSPHHAARLENIEVHPNEIVPPHTNRPLVIEGVGGVNVPITSSVLSIDLFKNWNCKWVIVSKHYLGSINHTLLTIEALIRHEVPILGLIFNGEMNLDSETAILQMSGLPCIARLLPEKYIDKHTIQRYAELWKFAIKHFIT